jgi:hypothetical protein
VLTVRTRLHEWADLLWHRAMVTEVARATLTTGHVFSTEAGRIAAAKAFAAGRARRRISVATPRSSTT